MIQLAVVGCGLIGARHVDAIMAHPRCGLAAVVEPDLARPVPDDIARVPCLGDLDASVDGLILATPTALHHRQALDAIEAGLDVLIEKPIASTVDEAQAIADAARANACRVLVGHHRRHHPRVTTLKSLIDAGTVGDVVSASLLWGLRKPDLYFEGNWREGEEGSPILINAVHDVDLIRFLFGEIDEIAGFGHRGRRSSARTETAAFVLQLTSGAVVTLSTSDVTPGPWGFEMGVNENPNIAATGQDMLFVSGTRGAVSFPSLTVWTGSKDWSEAPSPHTLPETKGVPLDLQLSHFLDVIEGKASPLIDAEDGMKTLEATLTMQHISQHRFSGAKT